MIPDFQTVMLPLLDSLKESVERDISQTKNTLREYFELTDDELKELLPGKEKTRFCNNLELAKSHLLKAGLVENTSPERFKITSLGKQVLARRLNSIDTEYLRRFPGYFESMY